MNRIDRLRRDPAQFPMSFATLVPQLAAALVACVASSSCIASDIFKCRSADGRLGYQGVPCDRNEKTLGRWTTADDGIPKTPPATRVNRSASIAISLSPDGAYYLDGTINGVPTRFQVDTGATTVSIPSQLGDRAGVSCKAAGISHTANGDATSCHSDVKHLTFGPFTLEDFPVTMLPNLDEALIGMNALRRLHMEQREGVLTLSF